MSDGQPGHPGHDPPRSLRRLPPHRPAPQPDLPAPLISLVGREVELTLMVELLADTTTRLLTLTGPGGVGKTSLARRLAALLHDRTGSAVWFVSLATIRDPELVVVAIAQALHVREIADQSLLAPLIAVLREFPSLLILDNFEQVVSAAPLVTDLLAGCSELQVIVTSRTRLRLTGEQEIPIDPLALPPPDPPAEAGEVGRSPAVALFVARTRAVRPDFALTNANARTVAAICRRLDGLPLAIELAAARVAHLPPAALLARLEGPPPTSTLPLLTGGPRDLPDRLRTLRNAIAWSYDLLGAEERRFFCRLAVFAGGFTLAAAEQVAGRDDPSAAPLPPPATLDLVASLVDINLIRQLGETDPEPRFGLLETIREFAWERLEAEGESEAIQWRHANWVVGWAETVAPSLRRTATVSEVEQLAVEIDNLRTALAWAIARHDGELALRLAVATFQFWFLRAMPSEGLRWFDAALAVAAAPSRSRVDALCCAAALAAVQGDHRRPIDLAEEALTLARAADYPFGTGLAVFQFGVIAEWRGDLAQAGVHYQQALELMRGLAEPYWIALLVGNLAEVCLWQNHVERAAALAGEAWDRWHAMGNEWGIALSLGTAAQIARRHGDLSEAARLAAESLKLASTLGDRRGIAGAIASLAGVAADRGRPDEAVRLLGAAHALADTAGVRQLPHQLQYDRDLSLTRAQLDASRFAAAWEAGRMLSPADVTVAALAVTSVRGSDGRTSAGLRLTPRERQVLSLVVAGLSDRQIADNLALSVRTVSNNVSRILAKLGVESRTAAIAQAHRDRLLMPRSPGPE